MNAKTPILKQRVDFFPSDFEFSFSAKSQTTPHDSPGTRFLTPKISAIRRSPTGAPNAGGVGQKSATFGK